MNILWNSYEQIVNTLTRIESMALTAKRHKAEHFEKAQSGSIS